MEQSEEKRILFLTTLLIIVMLIVNIAPWIRSTPPDGGNDTVEVDTGREGAALYVNGEEQGPKTGLGHAGTTKETQNEKSADTPDRKNKPARSDVKDRNSDGDHGETLGGRHNRARPEMDNVIVTDDSGGKTRSRSTLIVNGSGDEDYTTIQDAVDAASTGDTIIVREDRYYEHVEIREKSLTIIGEDPSTTLIDGSEVGTGIKILSDGNHIEGIRVRKAEYGIMIISSSNNTISNSHLVNNDFSGVKFSGSCADNTVKDSLMIGNAYGVRFSDNSQRNTITNSTANNNNYGVYLQDSDNNTITGNTLRTNQYSRDGGVRSPYNAAGIYLDSGSDHNEIRENTCEENGDHGIYLYKSYNNVISDNNAMANGESGIRLTTSSFNSLVNNELENNGKTGITLANSPDNILMKNLIIENKVHGVKLDTSPHTTLSENAFTDCGLYIEGYSLDNWNTHSIDGSNTVAGKNLAYFTDLNGTTFQGDSYGQFILVNSTNVTIREIDASSGDTGITLAYSSRNTLRDNTCSGNLHYGIYLYGNSHHNSLINNTAEDNEHGIYIGEFSLWNVLDNNTCNSNERTGVFLSKQSGENIVKSQTGMGNNDGMKILSSGNQIRLGRFETNAEKGLFIYEGSSSNTIKNVVSNANEYGIYIENSASNVLTHNEFSTNNRSGIFLTTTLDSTLSDNVCSQNSQEGMHVGQSSSISILRNRVENNSYGIILAETRDSALEDNTYVNNGNDGMLLSDSGSNTIERNDVRSNDGYGVKLREDATDNVLKKNLFSHNGGAGIFLESGSSNQISMNNIISNGGAGHQARDNGTNNRWDNGALGNHWSDYSSKYPGAQKEGEIWDTPYEIEGSASARDRYPFSALVDLTPPEARAGDDRRVDQHVPMAFDGLSSTDNVGIVNYTWTFLYDGVTTTLYGAQPVFTFGIVGVYEITLRVRDSCENWDEDVVKINVRDSIPPVVDISGDIVLQQHRSKTMDGTASTDNIGIANYTWSVEFRGEEEIRYGSKFSYTFGKVGQYSITLTVTDAAGNSASGSFTVTVTDNTPPLANAGSAVTVENGTVVRFDGTASYDDNTIESYIWTFEYNDTMIELDGPTPSFNFSRLGTYSVKLTVTDGSGNNNSDTVKVKVTDGSGGTGGDDDQDDDTIGGDDTKDDTSGDDTSGDDGGGEGGGGDGGIDRSLLVTLGAGVIAVLIVIIVLAVIMKKGTKKAEKKEYQKEYDKLYGDTDSLRSRMKEKKGEKRKGRRAGPAKKRERKSVKRSGRKEGRRRRRKAGPKIKKRSVSRRRSVRRRVKGTSDGKDDWEVEFGDEGRGEEEGESWRYEYERDDEAKDEEVGEDDLWGEDEGDEWREREYGDEEDAGWADEEEYDEDVGWGDEDGEDEEWAEEEEYDGDVGWGDEDGDENDEWVV